MKRIGCIALGLALVGVVPCLAADDEDFYAYWGDGRAELSSYRVVQSRYGEAREGHSVLIFVTEEINRQTLVKVESDQPQEDRVYTLKLNKTLKFLTGIYPYSVMTSVFSAVEGGPSDPSRPFEARKITLSVQEWCGHVFEEVRVSEDRIAGDLNSYFEKEGRQQWSFSRPADLAIEDHLLIRIRELKGTFMAEGASRTLTMLPSLWQFRIQHKARELVQVTLTKGRRESLAIGSTAYTATPWSWAYGDLDRTVWVDTAYPHRILRWESSAGDQGELMVSKRLPYWGLHDIDDESLRDELEIPR